MSDPIKTQFGYHIIKVVDKKPATMRALADVRPQLVEQLGYERAQAQAADLAQAIAREVTSPADLDKAAQSNGLIVQESESFARDGQITGIGASPEAVARAFVLAPNEGVAGPLTARSRVRLHYRHRRRSPARAQPRGSDRPGPRRGHQAEGEGHEPSEGPCGLAAKLKGAADFDRIAKAAGVEPKTTELITRDAPIPDMGVAAEVMDIAFALPVGAVSDPITTDAGTALFKVIEKTEVTPLEWAANKDRFREEMLADRRNRFFASYLTKAKERMSIVVDREALQRALL